MDISKWIRYFYFESYIIYWRAQLAAFTIRHGLFELSGTTAWRLHFCVFTYHTFLCELRMHIWYVVCVCMHRFRDNNAHGLHNVLAVTWWLSETAVLVVVAIATLYLTTCGVYTSLAHLAVLSLQMPVCPDIGCGVGRGGVWRTHAI